MRQRSIRFKITLWYAGALIVVVLFTYFVIFIAGNQILQKTVRDNLIETVEHNVDEIEYFSSIGSLTSTEDVDHFIQYREGYLEIDDDFLDQVNEVYTALYPEDVTLLYGENPISKETAKLAFKDSYIQKITVDGTIFYVYDRKLTEEGLEGLWLRGVVSELQGKGQILDIVRVSMILLPAFVLIAIIGGYLIARRMLLPIQRISDAVSQIEEGGDLKKRIELGEGKDELHQLADSFNNMFQRLDESFEIERQFASDASHELRTPMSVITAQCEFSLEKRRSEEEYEKAMQVILRQSKKMTKLINDMLDFTRIEMKSGGYTKEPVDLTELVSSICADMAFIRDKGIILKYKVQENVTYAGNYDLLSRLLTNLLSNAYRYGKENGHIFVELVKGEQGIRLSVSDDGIGIAEEEKQKIFWRFYQADRSRSGEGTGLGLAMASEIARFHGGELHVESQYGKGSTFILYLP